MSGQTNQELVNFFRSDDNKEQLLNINQGGDNIKEVYVFSKSNTSIVSSKLDIFFDRISDFKGINNKKPQIEPIKLINNDNDIKVPPPAALIVYLTKSQLDELIKDINIKPILDEAGKIELDPKLSTSTKIIKNLKYSTIGQVYSNPKFKSDSFKIDDKTPDLLDDI